MKNRNKLALLLSVGLLLPFAASAKSLEQSYIESCRKGPDVPTPIAVVSPRVRPEELGQTVLVNFVVDATGHTADVTAQSDSNSLAASAVDAVRKWRFIPVRRNGAPVATRVVLPIRVVDSSASDAGIAMN